MVFILLSLLMNRKSLFLSHFIFKKSMIFYNVCGIIHVKPSRDFIRSLGMPMGLKGLLQMLNAIVDPTK
jgi:hypothetical protein